MVTSSYLIGQTVHKAATERQTDKEMTNMHIVTEMHRIRKRNEQRKRKTNRNTEC